MTLGEITFLTMIALMSIGAIATTLRSLKFRGADLDVVAASVVAAIDQHMVHAGFTQFAEGDLLRAGHIPAAAWTVGWLCVGTQHQ